MRDGEVAPCGVVDLTVQVLTVIPATEDKHCNTLVGKKVEHPGPSQRHSARGTQYTVQAHDPQYQYTVHSKVHSTEYTVHRTQDTGHYTVHSTQTHYTVSVYMTLTLHTPHSTLHYYRLHSTQHTVHSTPTTRHNAHTPSSVHSTTQCRVHRERSPLQGPT